VKELSSFYGDTSAHGGGIEKIIDVVSSMSLEQEGHVRWREKNKLRIGSYNGLVLSSIAPQ